jgi:hypothetical protein
MGVERSAPTETPGEVLDRVLDKGIVSFRLGEAPIELIGRETRIVVESVLGADGYGQATPPPRAA